MTYNYSFVPDPYWEVVTRLDDYPDRTVVSPVFGSNLGFRWTSQP